MTYTGPQAHRDKTVAGDSDTAGIATHNASAGRWIFRWHGALFRHSGDDDIDIGIIHQGRGRELTIGIANVSSDGMARSLTLRKRGLRLSGYISASKCRSTQLAMSCHTASAVCWVSRRHKAFSTPGMRLRAYGSMLFKPVRLCGCLLV